MLDTSHIILVCDAKRGLIMRNQGNQPLHLEQEFHNDLAATSHQLGSSPPGRTSNKVGPGSAVATTNYHDQEKMRFIQTLAKSFIAYAQAHIDAAIIMIAPPKSLALLRQATAVDFKHRNVTEINKDITKNTIEDMNHFINKMIKK